MYSGDLLIESSLCMVPNRRYEILHSLIRVKDGFGSLIVNGLDSNFHVDKDTVMIRGIPLNKTSSLDVRRIENCPKNTVVTRIEPQMIEIDSDVDNDYRVRLVKLLNDFRKCFAFSSKELGRMATNLGKPENVWDECVSEIQWGLNNTKNSGTGKSPAQALFGLNLGDLVRVEREIPSTGKSRKLVPKLRGPYRIVQVLGNDRYVVEDTPLSRKGNRKFSGVFSIDKIFPWVVFNRNDSDSDTASKDDSD
ncbi:hypothetical protein ACJJTC_019592 [Scirpophaga incertulas]